MSEEKIHNLIIIGSGPAGYTAAIYAARADLNPVMIQGQMTGGAPGGQLMLTNDVENFPGFPEGIMGPELMDKMKKQAERFGTKFISADVVEVDFSSQPFSIKTNDGKAHRTKSVIISTGAVASWLEIESEKKLRGLGISACATCDGVFFRDKKIIVVGGGDSAMEEANFLTKFASHVYVVVRRDKLRASKIMAERAEKNKKISFIWNSKIVEVKDVQARKVTGVVLENTVDGTKNEMDIEGIFVAIGHKPNTAIFAGQIDIDEKGYIKPVEGVKTNIEGVFAAGDVSDFKYRQAITAAGTGCAAALEAERFLER